MLAHSIFLITLLTSTHQILHQQKISIQLTDEVFVDYLPLNEQCDYPNQTNIQQGSASYTQITEKRVFEEIQYGDQIVFWSTIKDGLDIMLKSGQVVEEMGMQQMVLYDSNIQDNFGNRLVILSDVQLAQIVFEYVLLDYIPYNDTVAINVKNQTKTAFNASIQLKLVDCSHHVDVCYLGNNLFGAICKLGGWMAVWNSSNSTQYTTYELNQALIDGVAPNPHVLFPGQISHVDWAWNLAILALNPFETTTYCLVSLKKLDCFNISKVEVYQQMMLDRGWGVQSLAEDTIIEKILVQHKNILYSNFQGEISTVYSNPRNIYIESITENQTFINIYTTNGIPLINYSLIGEVALFSYESLLLERDNGTFYQAKFQLPFYTITMDNSDEMLEFSCANNLTESYNYSIFWSTFDYPSSIAYLKQNSTKISHQNIYTYDIFQNFQLFGPALDVYLQLQQNIDIVLLSPSIIQFQQYVQGILDVVHHGQHYGEQLFLYMIFYNKNGHLSRINFKSGETNQVAMKGCGQVQQNVHGAKTIGGSYFMWNSEGDYCMCSKQFNDCQEMNQNQAIAQLYKSNKHNTKQYAKFMLKLLDESSFMQQTQQDQQQQQPVRISKQLFDLFHLGIIVQIYTNNSASLFNVHYNKTFSTVSLNCSSPNSTNGAIFSRTFYDDYLTLYCYGYTWLSQYIIRDNSLILTRIVPIYGFVARQDGKFLSGLNYMFLEVDNALNESSLYNKIQGDDCCVLRLKPSQYTVSMITEIVRAKKIALLESLVSTDIAYYNQTSLGTYPYFLKIYYQTEYISFNNTNICINGSCLQKQFNYKVVFNSYSYNLASIFNCSIIFNVTNSILSGKIADQSKIITMTLYPIEQTGYKEYKCKHNFSFNGICGPIQSYHQYRLGQSLKDVFMQQTNKIITSNKIIGGFNDSIMQIIDLGDYTGQDSLLSNYIMIVQEDSIVVYQKYKQEWMVQQFSIQIRQGRCIYYLSQLQQNQFITFDSYCYNIFPSTPILTIFLLNNTLFYRVTNQTNQVMPLRQIQTIIRQGEKPVLVGRQEGPLKSYSGMIYICDQKCSSLKNQNKYLFIHDSCLFQRNEFYLVIGLDVETISIWKNIPFDLIGVQKVFEPDIIFEYMQTTGQSCNKVQIVNATQEQASILLSCTNAYFYVSLIFPSKIQLVTKYQKYENCESFNRFSPIWQTKSKTAVPQIDLLIVECHQNLNIIRLEEYESVSSGMNTQVVTGYLQVYVKEGPQCTVDGISLKQPVRILPLSNSMQFKIYQTYYYGKQLKLLYQQIGGVLYDSFIELQPTVAYTYIPLTHETVIPKVQLLVHNAYSFHLTAIRFQLYKNPPSDAFKMVVYLLFAAFNTLTIVFLICWFATGQYDLKKKTFKTTKSSERSLGQFSSVERSASPKSRWEIEGSSLQRNTGFEKSRPQMAKRQTQIQLFQPRFDQDN